MRTARPKVRFCLVFERELLSVPVMRQVLGDTLRGIGVNEDSVADILLAATEACTNVVLHAGKSAPAFTVAATVNGAACRVEVTDAGRGYPAAPADDKGQDHSPADPPVTQRPATPEPRDPEPEVMISGRAAADIRNLPESGRGLAIMRACMDGVTLRSAPGRGTRVVLRKRISWEDRAREAA